MRAVVKASGLVMVGLLASASATWNGVHSVREAFGDVEQARQSVVRFEAVRDAVSDEAFAEAAYRRAPGPSTRTELLLALADVPATLKALSESPAPEDRAVAQQVTLLNDRYSSEVRGSITPGTREPGTTADDRVAGPALDTMDQLIKAGIAGHRSTARSARERQHRIIDRLAWELPVLFAACLATVAACILTIVRTDRRLHREAVQSKWDAEHDALTGLATRNVLWERLNAALALPRPDCGLLLVDLNKFKEINDTLGHAAGDEVLVETARRLLAAAPDPCLVCRLGGDEFAIFVPSASALQDMAHVVREAMQPDLVLDDGRSVRCTGSIGTAVARPGWNHVDVLRAADLEMYDGKPRRSARIPDQHRPAEDALHV